MFTDFANVWTTVIRSNRLRAQAPLGLEVAGEKVVFFRDATGKAAALIDRCPHRGARLSLGTVRNGCLQCPFHAWTFDADGSVRHVPLNPDAHLQNLRARTRAGRAAVAIYVARVRSGDQRTRRA